ncbi:MAG TPA: RNA polymerase sigma factor [Ktedonobacterales bacterium]|jgi:RNA polymerase sigma-70 factor, ECF subfamily|nr:RNA polymerase sigma factor [Ktedonobacterales bacterium]
MDHDEEEQLQGWRRGDEAAAREVFTRYYPRAVRIALLSGLSAADAQDCAQDAFVQAYERRAQLRDLRAFPLWFHRIVTRRILDMLTGPLKRERPLESESGAESWNAASALHAPPSDELVVLAEEREEIWRWVQALAPRARTAIVLRYYADFSTREVASMLDVREGAARVILHRAIAELRERTREARVYEPSPAQAPER